MTFSANKPAYSSQPSGLRRTSGLTGRRANGHMSLRYKFNRAQQIVEALNSIDGAALNEIGRSIQMAEQNLSAAASDLLTLCSTKCRGLCCRNVYPDELITLTDAVLILSRAGSMGETIFECAENESLFTANCVFLKNGTGPCMFPPGTKPHKCIATFCGNTGPVRQELRALRSRFNTLFRFMLFKKPGLVLGF